MMAADCTAFALNAFHRKILRGKTLGIACPKFDNAAEAYESKIMSLIKDARINTITVVVMEVPCCKGLLEIALGLAALASPGKLTTAAIAASIFFSVIFGFVLLFEAYRLWKHGSEESL